MIDITGLDKAAVLAALYNASRPLGMGFMQYDSKPMTAADAAPFLESRTDFDYLKGRVMKVDLKGNTFDPRWYDRDNGDGAAAKAVDALRVSGNPNNDVIALNHKLGREEAAEAVRGKLRIPSKLEESEGNASFTMGFADVADALEPRIEAALADDAK
jgi:hypothetical protein